MRHAILITVTLALGLLPSLASASLPDLCDDVYLNEIGAPVTDSDGTKLSRFCEWTGPSAPVWANHVCCALDGSDASCTPTDANGRCTSGFKMWCDYAEETAGKVTCYQPLPDACEGGLCVDLPAGASQIETEAICCVGSLCYSVALDENCPGSYYLCEAPFTNDDGTVGCGD